MTRVQKTTTVKHRVETVFVELKVIAFNYENKKVKTVTFEVEFFQNGKRTKKENYNLFINDTLTFNHTFELEDDVLRELFGG